MRAQDYLGISFSMIQTDNGGEFGKWFHDMLQAKGVALRHTRLQRPNDNAHIERFNRTIQTECIGHCWNRSILLQSQQAKLTAWLEYYNNERVHLGIQLLTPMQMLQRS